MKIKSVIKKILKYMLWAHAVFIGISSLFCIVFSFVNPPTTSMILYRKLTADYSVKKRAFIKLEKIPKHTRRMLVISEDSRFYTHFGIDFSAVKYALERNRKKGKIRIGGSTITQQAARSIFLTTHRNYLRKYLEAWISLEMELFMSKDRIMELYFNYVEWGKGIFGIETASMHYFSKSASRLSVNQSKSLIVILANPIRYNPHNYHKSRTLQKRKNHIERWFHF